MAHPGVTDVCQELIYRAELPAVPTAVKQARRTVGEVMESWELHPGVASDAVLLAAEIFTNAVKFGAGPQPRDGRQVAMVVRYLAGEVVVEVSDSNSSPPVLREPGPGAEHGRGLQVVDRLSDRWGYNPLPGGGKSVYCVLSTGGRALCMTGMGGRRR